MSGQQLIACEEMPIALAASDMLPKTAIAACFVAIGSFIAPLKHTFKLKASMPEYFLQECLL